MVTRNRQKKTISMKDFNPEGGVGGGSFVIPEGEYPMKVESVELTESNAGNDMFKWVLIGTAGKAKGKKFYYNTVFDPPQRLGMALLACGIEIEDELEVSTVEEAEGCEVIGVVQDDEYQGKKRSSLKELLSPDEASGEDVEEEEAPARGRKAKPTNGKAKTVKLSEDEVKAMDEDELEELLTKHDLDVDLSKSKTLSKKRNAALEALTEAELIA